MRVIRSIRSDEFTISCSRCDVMLAFFVSDVTRTKDNKDAEVSYIRCPECSAITEVSGV